MDASSTTASDRTGRPAWRARLVPAALAGLIALAMAPGVATATNGLEVTDLTDPALDAADLADQLTGAGVTVSNVSYVGDDRAAGSFTGGDGIIGFDDGIILSSGQVVDVGGPNELPNTTTDFGLPGDADLTALAGVNTFDAAILEFDFVPDADTIFFQYVFGSEEYNEFVSGPLTGVNDSFGFFVNDQNCALVPNPDDPNDPYPVSITTVNNGQPGFDPVNPGLYINNDPFNPDSTGETVPPAELLDTEMDGLTVVLTCEAAVNEGETNTMKLAIADGGDGILDSWVLIEAGSLTTTPTDPEPERSISFEKTWTGDDPGDALAFIMVILDEGQPEDAIRIDDGDTLVHEAAQAIVFEDDVEGLPAGCTSVVTAFVVGGSSIFEDGEFIGHPHMIWDEVEAGFEEGTFTNLSEGDVLIEITNHVTCEEEPDLVFEGESAWAANGDTPGELRYRAKGNWATYVEYEGEKTTTLFAGQHIPVGTVHFSDAVDGVVTITVALDGPWVFADDDENLKVQDYATAPQGNPAPGRFDWKFQCLGSTCAVTVDANGFYGVHTDVGTWVPDPDAGT